MSKCVGIRPNWIRRLGSLVLFIIAAVYMLPSTASALEPAGTYPRIFERSQVLTQDRCRATLLEPSPRLYPGGAGNEAFTSALKLSGGKIRRTFRPFPSSPYTVYLPLTFSSGNSLNTSRSSRRHLPSPIPGKASDTAFAVLEPIGGVLPVWTFAAPYEAISDGAACNGGVTTGASPPATHGFHLDSCHPTMVADGGFLASTNGFALLL
jgi:hypothetical protein